MLEITEWAMYQVLFLCEGVDFFFNKIKLVTSSDDSLAKQGSGFFSMSLERRSLSLSETGCSFNRIALRF